MTTYHLSGVPAGSASDQEALIATIVTELQPNTPRLRNDRWRAYLDGDRARWECAQTEAEAVGKIIQTYFQGGTT